MSEPFIGEIRIFAGNFAPRGWALCDGQLLDIASHSALFSILGTTYGGDGRTTLGLPELRGRVPVHAGNGPGVDNVSLGQKSGSNTQTLTVNQLPSHSHTLRANTLGGSTDDPSAASFGEAPDDMYNTSAATVAMSSSSIQETGGGQPVSIMQPFLGLNFIIALVGLFPSRN